MSKLGKFKIAGGTVTGSDHSGIPGAPLCGNNQDSFGWIEFDRDDTQEILAIVCDGISKGSHSEIGAVIIKNLLMASLLESVQKDAPTTDEIFTHHLKVAQEYVLTIVRKLATAMVRPGYSFDQVIFDHFLCTITGAYVTEDRIFFFGVGDGYYGYDRELWTQGPFPKNKPPTLCNLLREVPDEIDCDLQIFESIAAGPRKRVFISTDGLKDFLSVEKNLDKLFGDDSVFSNEVCLGRNLRAMNKVTIELKSVPDGRALRVQPSESQQVLSDDLALIMLRREPQSPVQIPLASRQFNGSGPSTQIRFTPIGSLGSLFGAGPGAKKLREE